MNETIWHYSSPPTGIELLVTLEISGTKEVHLAYMHRKFTMQSKVAERWVGISIHTSLLRLGRVVAWAKKPEPAKEQA